MDVESPPNSRCRAKDGADSAGEYEGLVEHENPPNLAVDGRTHMDDRLALRKKIAVLAGGSALAIGVLALTAFLMINNKKAEAYMGRGAAEVARLKSQVLHNGPMSNKTSRAPAQVTFVTTETRGDPILQNVLNFTQNFTPQLINIGLGYQWHNFRTKVELLADWLKNRTKQNVHKDPHQGLELIAFVDGSDVFWGGCDLEYFMQSYFKIVHGSGAQIVFSAEVVCGEQDCNAVPDVPEWANKMGGKQLDGGFWKRFATGCKGTWNDGCAAKRDCGFWAPCSKPPTVKFLNSGFFIGPLHDVSKMVSWVLDNYDKYSVWGDQSVFAVYWLKHQATVALDYTGALAVSLSDMSFELVQASADLGLVWNQAFDHAQCLIHGNGRGKFFMMHVLKALTGQELRHIRGW